MQQQERYQDDFNVQFDAFSEMLGYHESQSRESTWTRSAVKDLYVEPLDLASRLVCGGEFAEGISMNAVYDTMSNLRLAIRVNGAFYPVRETAYQGLIGRAKIGGTALPKLKRAELAAVLNTCLQLFRREALVLVRDEKVSAVHSGDSVDYSILPIDELLRVLQSSLDVRFPENVFLKGYSDHSVTSAAWMFPKQREKLLAIYERMLVANGSAVDASKFVPGIRFTTSDTGVASAKVSAVLFGGKIPIPIGGCVSVEHRNRSTVEMFEKSLGQLFSQFGNTVKKLQDLIHVWLNYPVNAMTRVCKKLCLPKRAAAQAIAMFRAVNGETPATAHDVFFALQEVLFELQAERVSEGKRLFVEESIMRALSLDWSEFDLATGVNY